MKQVMFGLLAALVLGACNITTTPPNKALGVLEVQIDTNGLATAKLETGLSPQALTYREPALVVGTGSTQVVSATNSIYDYLVATFPISHAPTSASAFQNLTLYALAKNGSVADTAISSISNFGGVTDPTEQARIVKHLVPVHAVTTSAGSIVLDNSKADFQAFSSAEVSAATTAAGSAINAADTMLNYGFSARCATACTANLRRIAVGSTGSISIALRVPKAAAATTYGFRMSFVVFDESVSSVTRSVFPPETVAQAETRAASVGASRLMQFGLLRDTTSLASDTVDNVYTSKLGATVDALGLGRISAGYDHTCGLTATGKAYCWGNGASGQLGNNTNLGSYLPVAVEAPTGGSVLNFSSIGTGWDFSCGIALDGAAYCWGSGSVGKLGHNATTNSLVPVAVEVPTGGSVLRFSSLSVGWSHTCGIALDTAAYCWGFGGSGRLGQGAITNSLVPVAVWGGLGWVSIAAGGNFSCGISASAAAYCWGVGTSGQLGIGGSTASQLTPTAVHGSLSFSSISTGSNHVCGVGTTGAAYCWGAGSNGKLGNSGTTGTGSPVAVVAPTGGNTLSFSRLAAGGSFTCGITVEGSAYCWGYGGNGQLGDGTTTTTQTTPVLVSGGLVWSNISAGNNHICAMTSSGTAHCWGNGADGRIGNNSFVSLRVPNQVNSGFTL
jgi:alpha-tubulin suppressor-like RCC1 family protein